MVVAVVDDDDDQQVSCIKSDCCRGQTWQQGRRVERGLSEGISSYSLVGAVLFYFIKWWDVLLMQRF